MSPLGLGWRVDRIRELAARVSGDRIPGSQTRLQELPGVGAYVAAAYLSLHLRKRAVLVDANIVRWICRLVGRPQNDGTRRAKWLIEIANALTPVRSFTAYNYAVLDFSMTVCKKSPVCEQCPIETFCVYAKSLKRSGTL